MRFGVKRLMIGTALLADLFGLILAVTKGGIGNDGCWCGWHGASPYYRVLARLELVRGACPFHQSIAAREWFSLASMTVALVLLSLMLVCEAACGRLRNGLPINRPIFGPPHGMPTPRG